MDNHVQATNYFFMKKELRLLCPFDVDFDGGGGFEGGFGAVFGFDLEFELGLGLELGSDGAASIDAPSSPSSPPLTHSSTSSVTM